MIDEVQFQRGLPEVNLADSKDFPSLALDELRTGRGTSDHIAVEEYEAERRYAPIWASEKPTTLEVENFLATVDAEPGVKIRKIEQAYVYVRGENGKEFKVRLRKTTEEDGKTLYRIAYKKKVKGEGEREGRFERQIHIQPDNPDDPRVAEFERLWEKHKWDVIRKTRRVIKRGSYEIHVDTH